MATGKKGFVLYADQKELFSQLPNDKAGELIKHIFSYVNDEEPETNDIIINLAFTPIKQQLKRDLDKWEGIKESRSKAGKASAEARKIKNKQVLTNSTSVECVQQSSTNSTVKDNVNVNVKDIHTTEDFSSAVKDFCSNYMKALESNNRLLKSQKNNKQWKDPIRLMIERDGINIDEMKQVANMYFQNFEEPYLPQCYSTKTFRSKYMNLKTALNRLKNDSN